jgi:hypothetical protein
VWRGTWRIPSQLQTEIQKETASDQYELADAAMLIECDWKLSRIRGWTTSARRMVQQLTATATAAATTAAAMAFGRLLERVVGSQGRQFANCFLGGLQ